MKMVSIEFYHHGEHLFTWQDPEMSPIKRLYFVWLFVCMLVSGKSMVVSITGESTRTVNGREYKF